MASDTIEPTGGAESPGPVLAGTDGRTDGRIDGRIDGVLSYASDQIARMEKNLLAAEEQMAQLQIALQTNRRIGMAIGILMAINKIDEDEAFALLRTASSRRNIKLRAVAEEVIRAGTVD